jgi:type II secretory pathway component PulC
MDKMFMLDTTLTLAGLIIAGVIFTAIFWIIYVIGKFVQALTALEQSVNTLEQVSTTVFSAETLKQDSDTNTTEDK